MCIRDRAKTNKSALALEMLYGLDVCSGVVSVKNKSGRSNGRSPYTSSVDT